MTDPRTRRLVRDFLGGDPYMPTDEVATLFRVDRRTVGQWARLGRFPLVGDGRPTVLRTPGGDLRFRASVVRGLLDGTLQPREARRG